MPKQYVAIRNKLAKKEPLKRAKAEAAAIYNSTHKARPVTRKSK